MKRADIIAQAEQRLDAPYIWRGKGMLLSHDTKGLVAHNFGVPVFDCSGLATDSIRNAGGKDMRATHNAQLLATGLGLELVALPKEADLAFYGADWNHVTHVMVHRGDGTLVGACGGGADTTTIAIANARGARVRIRYSASYRKDFLGFRSIASLVEDP